MGGWDYYCFLCATGFYKPYYLEHDEDFEDNDEDVPQNESQDASDKIDLKALFPKEKVVERIQWLTKFRTIGQNRHAAGLTQCYLSGPARESDYGQVQLATCDHPNAQHVDNELVDCYRSGDEESGDLPVHDHCFAILCKVFADAQGFESEWCPDQTDSDLPFDLDSLFSCLAATRREYQAYLTLDHEFMPEQYFEVEWHRIHDYFETLDNIDMPPVISASEATNNSGGVSQPSSNGLFDTLPHELLTQILDLTHQSDLVPLMRASKIMHRITKSNVFWKHRLRLDAPWLWEYYGSENMSSRDWQKYYNNVMMQTHKPLLEATKGRHVSGLANRRRIWHVCEQVLRLYLEKHDLSKPEKPISVFEEDVDCRYLPMVATQDEPQFTSKAALFFNTESDLHSEKQLKLTWTEKGALSGISVTTGAGEQTFGSLDPDTESVLHISSDDWIEKLVLSISVIETSKTKSYYGEKVHQRLAVSGVAVWLLSQGVTVLGKEEGHKRLLEPDPQNGIAGLKSQFAQGVITHLGLLEHRLVLTRSRPEIDSTILDLLWKNQLPSTELRFKSYHMGYWMSQTRLDVTPMDTLLFGTTDGEQSTVIGFGAAANLGCFELYRSDGSCERIGQASGPVKVFPLDGPGGERIAGVEVTIGHLPLGLTLITTHGRQVQFGRRVNNTRVGHTSAQEFGIAGLYCSYAYNSVGRDELSSVGVILSPHIDRPPVDDRRLVDETGFLWEPQPPPPSWHSIGQTYGPKHRGEVVMCMDFSRPIEKIDGLLPAPNWLAMVEIGGFIVSYGDDNPLEPISTLGFPSQQWPSEEDATPENLKAMKRYAGMSHDCSKEVDAGQAHVETDQEALDQPKVWDLGPGGERIVAVTVWSGDYVDGLQFHSESAKSSPRWGKCGGESSATIRAGGEERIAGLKVVLGSKRLGHAAPTLSPQAVQAMSDAPQ